MRLIHTSDWHAGRNWKNIDRLGELEAVLADLGDHMERERADILLVSGDVFDTGAPLADAERVVFRFLRRVGDLGVQSVVIAGNHDSPARLSAWGQFAELAGVHVVGRPSRADAGGVLRLTTAAGETAVIAALPFASMKDLVAATQLADSDTGARQAYADGMRRMIEHLCASFEAGAVNVLVAHTHLQAAVLGGSERRVHVGEQWAATPQALPPDAHYVALGHIHKPQTIAAPSPAEYAGSPLQLDFGEEGDAKSFVVIDAVAGAPARITRVPYQGGRVLRTVTATLAELEARADELRAAGWLRVRLPVERPDPELAGKVRRLLTNAVVVEVQLPEPAEEGQAPALPSTDALPRELFRSYFSSKHGREPDQPLLAAFDGLLTAAERDAAP
jgi:exonuclease SbcD